MTGDCVWHCSTPTFRPTQTRCSVAAMPQNSRPGPSSMSGGQRCSSRAGTAMMCHGSGCHDHGAMDGRSVGDLFADFACRAGHGRPPHVWRRRGHLSIRLSGVHCTRSITPRLFCPETRQAHEHQHQGRKQYPEIEVHDGLVLAANRQK